MVIISRINFKVAFILLIMIGLLYALVDTRENLNEKQSIDEVKLQMVFTTETNFIFQIPMIHKSSAFSNLAILNGESEYQNISISIKNVSINETTVEYLQINGTGTVFSLHSKITSTNLISQPDFNNLLHNPIYLKTSNNITMRLTLFYSFDNGNRGPTSGVWGETNIIDNVVIENGWRMYEIKPYGFTTG